MDCLRRSCHFHLPSNLEKSASKASKSDQLPSSIFIPQYALSGKFRSEFSRHSLNFHRNTSVARRLRRTNSVRCGRSSVFYSSPEDGESHDKDSTPKAPPERSRRSDTSTSNSHTENIHPETSSWPQGARREPFDTLLQFLNSILHSSWWGLIARACRHAVSRTLGIALKLTAGFALAAGLGLALALARHRIPPHPSHWSQTVPYNEMVLASAMPSIHSLSADLADAWRQPGDELGWKGMEGMEGVEGMGLTRNEGLPLSARFASEGIARDAMGGREGAEANLSMNEGVGSEEWEGRELEEEEIGPMKELIDHRLKNPRPITVPLRIVSLSGSMPPGWTKAFVRSQGKQVNLGLEAHPTLNSIFDSLVTDQKSKNLPKKAVTAADLVTIGDSWLELAVSKGLLSPIPGAEEADWFKRLGHGWQTYLRRDASGAQSGDGKVYAAPYRWGCTVVAYKGDELARRGIPPITDWSDLWHPSLQGRVAFGSSPQEAVGAVLKSLGGSFNEGGGFGDVEGGREAVAERFLALRKQACVFDDSVSIKALAAKDAWVVVGPTNYVLPAVRNIPSIKLVVPESGTLLWADLWAVPAVNRIKRHQVGGRIHGPSPLISQWIDFCLQPARCSSFLPDVLPGASPLDLRQGPPGQVAEIKSTDVAKAGMRVSGKDACQSGEGLRGEGGGEGLGRVEGEGGGVAGVEELVKRGVVGGSVLGGSEFLEPLSKQALEDYRWLLQQEGKAPTHEVHSRFGAMVHNVKALLGAEKVDKKDV